MALRSLKGNPLLGGGGEEEEGSFTRKIKSCIYKMMYSEICLGSKLGL